MRMTWRERLADWISGGALTRARNHCVIITAEGSAYVSKGTIAADNAKLQQALRDIAAMETAGANGTVKRMARLAREALE